jgi:apolipoprotein N-acyltransferase
MKKKSRAPSNLKNYLPSWNTFLSAVLIVVSFPPWNLWPLLWVALIGWFFSIQKAKTPKEAAIQGIWLGYFMSIGGFYWVAYALKEYGGVPWILSIVGLQIFALFNQPQFFLFAYIYKHFEERTQKLSIKAFTLSTLFFALIYTGLDWILPKLFLDTLGHAFYLARYLRQVADLGGAACLTFIVFYFNLSAWDFLKQAQKTKFKSWNLGPQQILALAICLLCWSYGFFRYQAIQSAYQNTPTHLRAAAIQANIGDFDKIAAERGIAGAAYRIIDTYIEMSQKALQLDLKPEIMIWPETSYPTTFGNPHSKTEDKLEKSIREFSQQNQMPLLFGGYDRSNMKDFNAFFHLMPSGDSQVYRKNILLLFGEYIPFAENIDLIRNLFPQVGNFGRGEGPQVLSISLKNHADAVRMSPVICYEALFPNYAIEGANKGSQLIMNTTNDSWFGPWGEPQLHLSLTTFRSIETRIPMLRATNTGISTLITADGEITSPTQIGTQEILNVSVPILSQSIPTLMKSWGDWFGGFSLALGWIGLILTHLSDLREYLVQIRHKVAQMTKS